MTRRPYFAFGVFALAACAAPAGTGARAPGSGTTRAAVPEPRTPNRDPRVGLRAGWMDAAEAVWNLRVVSRTPPSPQFMNPSAPGDFRLINSDISFSGHYAIQGNFSGIQVWDIADPAHPRLHRAFVCPGSQSDVSVFRNLLFVSGEALDGRTDCGTSVPEPRRESITVNIPRGESTNGDSDGSPGARRETLVARSVTKVYRSGEVEIAAERWPAVQQAKALTAPGPDGGTELRLFAAAAGKLSRGHVELGLVPLILARLKQLAEDRQVPEQRDLVRGVRDVALEQSGEGEGLSRGQLDRGVGPADGEGGDPEAADLDGVGLGDRAHLRLHLDGDPLASLGPEQHRLVVAVDALATGHVDHRAVRADRQDGAAASAQQHVADALQCLRIAIRPTDRQRRDRRVAREHGTRAVANALAAWDDLHVRHPCLPGDDGAQLESADDRGVEPFGVRRHSEQRHAGPYDVEATFGHGEHALRRRDAERQDADVAHLHDLRLDRHHRFELETGRVVLACGSVAKPILDLSFGKRVLDR